MTENSQANEISVSGIDKAELLGALYCHIATDKRDWTLEQWRAQLQIGDDYHMENGIPPVGKRVALFSKLFGAELHVNLTGDILFTGPYNRFHGERAAESVIAELRSQKH